MAQLHHMGITVSDTARTVEFYRVLADVTVTGPLVRRGPAVEAVTGRTGAEIWITFIEFDEGGAVIELAEYRGSTDEPLDPANHLVGAAHPAIIVLDIEATIERLARAGYRATSEPHVAGPGPMEGMRYTYIIGPDEVRVELLERPHTASVSS